MPDSPNRPWEPTAAGRSLRDVLNVPPPEKKRFSRRRFLKRIGKLSTGAAAVGTAVGGGTLAFIRWNDDPPPDPSVFNPNAKKGVLTSLNTIAFPIEEAVVEARRRTLEDGRIYFTPPQAEGVTFKRISWEPGLWTIDFDGFPEGTVFVSPYGGELTIDERNDAEDPYKDIEIVVDKSYGAKPDRGPVARALFRVPFDTDVLVPPEQLSVTPFAQNVVLKRLPYFEGGRPLFRLGSGRFNRGQLEISNGYILTDSNDKAILQASPP